MRAAYDQQIFLLQRRGGITRYFVELINAFTESPGLGVEPVLPFRWVSSDSAGELRGFDLRDVDSRLARRVLTAAGPSRPDRFPAGGVMHHTFYHPAFLNSAPGLPKVVTVYDMIPERFPESVTAGDHLAKSDYLDRADLILTISEATKTDLLRFHDVGSTPVVVTPLAVDPVFGRGGPDPLPGSDYVLYVGRRGSYKDFPLLVRAVARLPDDAIRLLAVGGGAFDPDERALLHDLGVADRVIHRDLHDAGLAGAYGHARAFVMPSRYEGFGLPILEAMSAGAPVIAAKAASLPEVGGEAALYFEPGDPQSLTEVLTGLLGDASVAQRLGNQGRSRAAAFTWSETARLTAAAYALVSEPDHT